MTRAPMQQHMSTAPMNCSEKVDEIKSRYMLCLQNAVCGHQELDTVVN